MEFQKSQVFEKPNKFIDNSGKQILLAARATYNQQQLTLSGTTLSLDLSAQANGTWQLTIANNFYNQASNQAVNSPLVQLIGSGNSISGQVLLAEIEVTTSALTITPKAVTSQLLESRMPAVTVSNLNASVITSGVFDTKLIPDLQDLSGTLTSAQIPFLNGLDKAVFTPGILNGLAVTANGQNVIVTTGTALNSNYSFISLSDQATYNGQTISQVNGSFTLDTSSLTAANAPWLITIQNNATTPASPVLSIVAPADAGNTMVLGSLQQISPELTVNNGGRQNLSLASGCLPALTPGLLPDIQSLNGQLTANQIPTLSATQVPELQNLKGQLLTSQLPADMPTAKEYLTFFVDKPVVNSGTSVNLSWTSSNGVTTVSLSYLSGSTIENPANLALTETTYPVSPAETTTYTLTALINGSTVAQKQLVVTVYDGSVENINTYASQLYQNGTSLSEAISMIASKFFLTDYNLQNATTMIKAVNQATYNALDCVSSVATYYSQSTNWSFMEQLAGLISAPQPSTLNSFIQNLPAPVPSLLGETNFTFNQYQAEVLSDIATPVGNQFFNTNLSTYALYCFANGMYTARSNPGSVGSWDSIVSSVVLNYYIQVKSVSAKQLPSDFPNIMTDATQ